MNAFPLPALVLADRDGHEFGSFLGGTLPALIPIAGKPVIEHTIEDLWEAGIREVVVAVPAGDTSIARQVGDGTRFGLVLRFVEVKPRQWPNETLAQAFEKPPAELIVARGDVLRGRCARTFATAQTPLHGTVGLRHAGIARLAGDSADINLLDAAIMRGAQADFREHTVDITSAGLSTLDGLAALYEASLAAIDGRFAGLVPDGRQVANSGLRLAPRASVPSSAHVHGTIRVGRGADVHHGVELTGRVEVGDRCVIDDDAHITNSVVMPGTYVGRGVSLHNAIASGPWMYRVDLDDTQYVDDRLLLAGSGPRVAA
jgi:hypothetical protein